MITKEQIFEILDEDINTDTPFSDYFSEDDFEQFEGDDIDVDEIKDYIYERFTDAIYQSEPFVYYANAWDWLKENDLQGYAMFDALQELGGITENTNICTAATALWEKMELDQLSEDLDTVEEKLRELMEE